MALGSVSALGLAGTSVEARALLLRGAFQYPFMYAPVVIPPIAAAATATAVLIGSSSGSVLLRAAVAENYAHPAASARRGDLH